jgi:hypothetical protein
MASRALQAHFHSAEEHVIEPVDAKRQHAPAVLRIIRPPSFMDTSFLNFDDISSDSDDGHNMELYANPTLLENNEDSSSHQSKTEWAVGRNEKQQNSQHSVFCGEFAVRATSILVYYGIGVLFYHFVEGWTALDCIYFTTVSSTSPFNFVNILFVNAVDAVTTVGYGDVTPTTAGESKTAYSSYLGSADGLLFVCIVCGMQEESSSPSCTCWSDWCMSWGCWWTAPTTL